MMDNTVSSGPSRVYRYQTVTIHPPDENGAREVWGEYEERCGGRVFETDGIIGWLYLIPDQSPAHSASSAWVWLNEAGHPTKVFHCFAGIDTLSPWLDTLAPIVTWAKEART